LLVLGGFERDYFFAERFGSGDGERKTLLTRQIAFEPLPASVLFGLGVVMWKCYSANVPSSYVPPQE